MNDPPQQKRRRLTTRRLSLTEKICGAEIDDTEQRFLDAKKKNENITRKDFKKKQEKKPKEKKLSLKQIDNKELWKAICKLDPGGNKNKCDENELGNIIMWSGSF